MCHVRLAIQKGMYSNYGINIAKQRGYFRIMNPINNIACYCFTRVESLNSVTNSDVVHTNGVEVQIIYILSRLELLFLVY